MYTKAKYFIRFWQDFLKVLQNVIHLKISFFALIFSDYMNSTSFFKKKLKTLWLLFMDGVHLPQGQSHFEETVYFLPLNPQKFLVLILSTS